jgi:hypothetical protein
MTGQKTIKAKERDTIIQALAAGVVPRSGLRHIQVGRVGEITALLRDVDRIAEGGSALRFVIGEYGAGKTFFLNLIRMIALERRLVTIHADLAPDRRIHATEGQARGLYAEALRNLSTRVKPDGGALAGVVEKFITECVREGEHRALPIEQIVGERLFHLQEMVSGHDFAAVIKAYWRGSEEGDEERKVAALRWIRGEYSTKTEARHALGVRTIIDDGDIYDGLRLLAAFVRLAGYSGLLVVFDEMANLYKLQSAQARNQNFEQILRILNDVLQGNVEGLGFLFGGTPEFLLDTRRGLYSYPALQSRLQENAFAVGDLVDLSGPVVRLQNLTPEEILVLLRNLRSVFALGDPERYLVPDEALPAFMQHCGERIGEAYFRTPRNTIRTFIHLLAVVEQNPGTDWRSLISAVEVAPDIMGTDGEDETISDDDLAKLRL